MNDLRFALRQLARAPGFTAVAVLTLGLGIGACAAIFSVVDQVLLRPLPLPEPERLVSLKESAPPRIPEFVVSAGKYRAWRDQSSTVSRIGAWTGASYILTGQGEPARLDALRMTASLLETLGLQPILGRRFTAADEKGAESEDLAILSHGCWQRRFGGGDVLHRVVTFNGRPFTIIGVMGRGAPLPERVEVLAPASFEQVRRAFTGHILEVFARLKPGVTLDQARSELGTIDDRVAAQEPAARGWRVKLEPLREVGVKPVRPALLALLGAVGFLLLIACANVANLLLARAVSRGKELAVRSALGASRARVVRQLLVESVLLALLSAGLAIAVAMVGLDGLLALAPAALPRSRDIGVDGRVLAFTLALAVATGVGFGLAPALAATRGGLAEALKQGGRGGESARRGRLRGALVVGELAIALVLLAGAGLLMRSFSRLHQVDPGFAAPGAVAASVHLPRPKYLTIDQYNAFARQTIEQLAGLPRVRAAAAATNLPFDDIANSWGTRGFAIEGQPPVAGAERAVASYYSVSPDYFRAMGVPLLRGRAFQDSDGPNTPRVAVISAQLARRFFPDRDPLGQRLTLAMGPEGGRQIVGVVGDVKPRSLEDAVSMQIYEPFAQMPDNDIIFVVRTAGPVADLPAALRTALARIDPDQPFNEIRPLTRLVDDSLARQRFALTLFAVFSAVALLLAAIGVYGVMAHAVSERRAELGIRMALGAQAADVVRLVLGQGVRLIAAGLLLGLVGALLLTRFLESLLFGIGARDPLTLAAIAVLLAVVAVAACLLPARRATRVPPMTALRAE